MAVARICFNKSFAQNLMKCCQAEPAALPLHVSPEARGSEGNGGNTCSVYVPVPVCAYLATARDKRKVMSACTKEVVLYSRSRWPKECLSIK